MGPRGRLHASRRRRSRRRRARDSLHRPPPRCLHRHRRHRPHRKGIRLRIRRPHGHHPSPLRPRCRRRLRSRRPRARLRLRRRRRPHLVHPRFPTRRARSRERASHPSRVDRRDRRRRPRHRASVAAPRARRVDPVAHGHVIPLLKYVSNVRTHFYFKLRFSRRAPHRVAIHRRRTRRCSPRRR